MKEVEVEGVGLRKGRKSAQKKNRYHSSTPFAPLSANLADGYTVSRLSGIVEEQNQPYAGVQCLDQLISVCGAVTRPLARQPADHQAYICLHLEGLIQVVPCINLRLLADLPSNSGQNQFSNIAAFLLETW
ncbi:hypothetical protein LR48_Vigan07g133800 [Vigna angularis]|uniref:Uncharacterized protein n=1 Tax=Phaseolus angularis TaxID=3914 RepID=A0A0L9UYL5_PHAAN|nr:hypothetical protein LR48_Vigan07g133800 [Vigna angularis]